MLEEALLPFLANFPTSRLKLITMYIEQRRAKDRVGAGAAVASAAASGNDKSRGLASAGGSRAGEVAPWGGGEPRGSASTPAANNRFSPIR